MNRTELNIRVDDKLWLSPEEVGDRFVAVYPLWIEPLQRLPITLDGRTFSAIRAGVQFLAAHGGPCFPGEIKPLEPGQSYGVFVHDARGESNGVWIAVIGRAAMDELPRPKA